MADTNFRSIQSIGREDLIKELMENSETEFPYVVQGPGDDAAVITGEEDLQLLTSESFTEGVDFDLTYFPLHHLGYKVATAVVSDIYAMNGNPKALLVNLSVPNKMSVDMLKEIYRGIGKAGKDYGFQIVGGDLSASHQLLGISVSAYGKVREDKIIYRNGAKVGDAVCVTGDLGAAIAGLRILMREKQYWEKEGQQEYFKPDLSDYEFVVQRQLVPISRKDFIEKINELEILPNAMIDVTQGLINDLQYITHSSNVGAYIYEAAIPIALDTRKVADEMKEDVDKYALYGGEDFELMFTLPEKLVKKLADNFSDFTVIGKVVEESEGVCLQQAEGDVFRFDEHD